MSKMPEPLHPATHAELTAQGYTRTHTPEHWEEVGDAENGPQVVGHTAYDTYELVKNEHSGHRVYADARGRAMSEYFDPEFEAEMERQYAGQEG